MKSRTRLPHFLALTLGGLSLTAAPAYANMPTSLLFAEGLHLVAGNALLGIVEGIVVGLVIRGRFGPAIGWMLLANYVSALAGVLLLNQITLARLAWVFGPPLEHTTLLTAAFALTFFTLTYAIEWPFCRRAAGAEPRQAARTSVANLAAHLVSYLLLVPFYVAASQTRLLNYLKVTPIGTVAAAEPVWIYYLDSTGHTRRMRADGSSNEPVAAEPVARPGAAWLRAKPAGKGRWDLVEGRSSEEVSGPAFDGKDLGGKVLLRDLPGGIGSQERTGSFGGFNYYWYVYAKNGTAGGCCEDTMDLRPAGRGKWVVCADALPWYGLMVNSREQPVTDRDTLHLGFETPFFVWASRCPNVLPSGQVVYQLGDQTVLADLDRRQIAFLARGTSPLAIRELPGERG